MSHVIQLAAGCSISTASRKFLKTQLAAQGFPREGLIESGLKGEFFKPAANPLFEPGMREPDLVMKTVTTCPPFIGKLPPKIFLYQANNSSSEPPLLVKMVAANCQFVHMYRANKLDQALCFFRDFGEQAMRHRAKVVSEGLVSNQFGAWRKSSLRRHFVFPNEQAELVSEIKSLENIDQQLLNYFKDQGVPLHSVAADELLRYQASDDPAVFANSVSQTVAIFDFLGLPVDRALLEDTMRPDINIRPPPSPHSALEFEQFSPEALRQTLVHEGLDRYWRE